MWWCSVEVIRDRDWVTEVQEGWKPIPIGDHLVIRFPWHTDQDVEDVGAGGRKTLLLEGRAAVGLPFRGCEGMTLCGQRRRPALSLTTPYATACCVL